MDIYIRNVQDSLKWANIRMKWYEETNNHEYLIEALDWIRVADIYGSSIKRDKKYETCESVN